jgi:DNA-binding response OmpR family regulator
MVKCGKRLFFKTNAMAQRAILTIEDDPAIRRGIVDALEYAGYQVLETGDGVEGAQLAVYREYDLLLLDLVLPGMSGLEILQRVREARPTLPVIILTARGEERDRVEGLKRGADDYVVKPFSVKELLARVEAVLRRSPERPSDVAQVSLANGHADLDRREIHFDDGNRVELSEKEVDLLRYLVQHSGRAISRDELLGNVWRISPQGVTTRTIDMHIARLREKLRDDPASPRTLLTVRGKGYMFAACLPVSGELPVQRPSAREGAT